MKIEQLGDIVAQWAESQPSVTRAYIYGSRVRGSHREDSDLDVAIEIQPLPGDSSAFATWISEAFELCQSLASMLPVPVGLEWYGGKHGTPTIHRGLTAGSVVVYERAARPCAQPGR
jgi:predicted nucleotidyltransferase